MKTRLLTTRLLRHRLRVFALIVGIMLLGLCNGRPVLAAEKLSLKYIPTTPVAAFVVHPKRMFDRKEFELMPLEVIQAAGLQELGFDPLQIEQVIAFGVFNPLINPPVDYGMIVRFAQPVDQKIALQKLPLPLEEKTHQGFRLKVARLPREDRRFSQLPALPAFCWADEKTLLVATEWTLRMMVTTDGTETNSPLLKQLAQKDDSADILAVVAMMPLRFMIAGVIGTLRDDIPPQLEPFQEVPNLIEAIEFRATIKSTTTLALQHLCKDQADARELESLLKQARQLGEQMLDGQLARMRRGEGLERAMGEYLQRIRQPLINLLMPSRDGRTLTTKIQFQPNLPQISMLVGLTVPGIQAARHEARQVQLEIQQRELEFQRELENRREGDKQRFERKSSPLRK